MAVSRHFEHLRTNFTFEPQTSISFDAAQKPDTNNKFELRRDRTHIKVPKRLAPILAKDKQLLKPFSIYFELKPLYYSSVIKNAKHHYPDLCKYLGISMNNLRQKVADMLRMDLAWWDGKDLRLVAYKKLCKRYELSNFYHKVNNVGNTELTLRTISIKENLDNQTYVCNKKIVNNAIKEELLQNELHKVKTLSTKYVVSIPEMVKRINSDNLEKVVSGTEIRKLKRVVKLRMDVLTKQMQERTDNNLLNGIKCKKTANPTTTLSCQSVAKMYGCESPSSGHYWEQKLAAENLLNITPEFLEIKNHRSQLIWEKQVQGQNNGVWSPKHINKKTKRKYYFLRLANNLSIINNPQTPLFI